MERQLSEAFETFAASLRETLTGEAKRSIDGAIKRMGQTAGPFRVREFDVDVVVHNLKLESATRSSTAPRLSSAPAVRGRPPGRLRTALLDAFEDDPDLVLDTDALRSHLDKRNIKATADNLHQHLRRLVQAGELERSGRGRYRRSG